MNLISIYDKLLKLGKMVQTTNNFNIQNMITEMKEKGVHFGHKKSRLHPKAYYFTLKQAGDIYYINLEETVKGLERAISFLQEVIKKGGKILLVGTGCGAKQNILKIAEENNFPYVIERWLGGTLTNFKTLKERINCLKEMENQREKGEWEKYTKKEKLKLEKNYQALEKKFKGLKGMESLPDAILIVDPGLHKIVVTEARKLKIPIVAILDNDDDPTIIDYPIPANDSAPSSINYILEQIRNGLGLAKKEISLNQTEEKKENLAQS
ncbi:MAG: 30S ribosomal protein S2 [Minisyncoccia bacterium]